jgi:hypothetical protein
VDSLEGAPSLRARRLLVSYVVTIYKCHLYALERLRFHNGCLRCSWNVFSCLGNSLILFLAIDCYGDNAYRAGFRQWTSLYALSRKRVLTSRCLAMDAPSDILAFRRHATLYLHNCLAVLLFSSFF